MEGLKVCYWRERAHEVDFVVERGKLITAREVKTGGAEGRQSGMEAFSFAFKPKRKLLVGSDGIPIEQFLETPIGKWIA